MQRTLPDVSKQIYSDTILKTLDEKYSEIAPLWASVQLEWINSLYKTFRDHEKFLILIYLIHKTFNFYSKNFVSLTYDQYFDERMIEIEKFNVMEVSKNLIIPKETARRKIIELEKIGAIKRNKKKLILDKSTWPPVKPEENLKRISRFLSFLSKLLHKEKIIDEIFNSEDIEKTIKENFSYIWSIYYDMQIPMMTNYKKIFGDFESFHVNGVCVVNQFLNSQNRNRLAMSKEYFLDKFFFDKNENLIQGVNAMSISDISGIPRPTVIRKLKKLVKGNFIIMDHKKHYTVRGNKKILLAAQKKVFINLATFCSKFYNLYLSQKTNNSA
mgnify:CR=1 FL=1|tara:strand:- start:16 stop:999 length:984 start_codon:yes stop_codon:yes gene_type:complete